MSNYTRLRPHWRPTHDATPHGFAEWVGGDGSNGWVKILNPDGHLVRQVLEVAPQAKILLRSHPISEQKNDMLRDPIGTAKRHVNFWAQWLRDHALDRYEGQLVFEGINEAAIWEPGYLDATVRYNVELLRYGHIAALTFGVLQMNTGWPTNHGVTDAPPDWAPFEPLRQALVSTGGYLCLHEYWDKRGPASDDWGWNPGRFTQLPDRWRGLPILITECGYDVAVNAPPGTPHHGWHGHLSKEEYLQQLYDYDQMLRESGWDVRAAFIFTHDWDEPWGTFDSVPLLEELKAHAQHVRSMPAPVPPQAQETTRLPSVKRLEQGEDWDRAITWVLREERGLQQYPDMPQNWTGGEVGEGACKGSAYGIYAAAYPDVDIASLTPAQASEIHYEKHWIQSQAYQMPWPLNLVVFDTAVVHGTETAKAWAQSSKTAAHFIGRRLLSYPGTPEWEAYGAGWTNRMGRLIVEMGDSL